MKNFIGVVIVLAITHIALWTHSDEFMAISGLIATLAFLILEEIGKGNKS